MSLPAEHKLSFVKGDEVVIQITIKDADGTPVDVTGRTYLSQLRSSRDAAVVLATPEVDMDDAETGIVRFTLSSEASDIDENGGLWGVRQTDTMRALIEGDFEALTPVVRVPEP
jgi:hypothetical protein